MARAYSRPGSASFPNARYRSDTSFAIHKSAQPSPPRCRSERNAHPEDRIYTVISGVFYIGFGDKFDGDAVTGYPPGTVLVLPGDTWHFHWAKSGEYVTQVTAIGPLGLEYANVADDPRHEAADVPT